MGGFGDAARDLGYRYKQRAIKGIKQAPRKLTRAAVGATLGGALGLAGAAVGAASGDSGNVAKLATLGAAGGFSWGRNIGDSIADEADFITKGSDSALYGEDIKARKQYLFDEQFKKSADNINTLASIVGRDDAVKAMRDGTVQSFLDNNITDPVKIAKALKLRNDYMAGERGVGREMDVNEATERAIAMAKWNRDSGMRIYETNSYARETFRKNAIEKIKQSNPNLSDDELGKRVDQILDDMVYFES